MEIKEENLDDVTADEVSGDPKPEEYTSSGESTMTCSTLSSLVSLPALESLSDSAPDLQQPDTKPDQCCVKRNRRGKRGRKPKQLPKTSLSDDGLMKESEIENMKNSGKRIKIMLPQKVSSSMMNPNPNPESSYSENRCVDDVHETLNALSNFNPSKVKNMKGNLSKDEITSENPTQGNDSDPIEFDDDHKDQIMRKNSDSGLSDKESPSKYSVEAEIAFETKVSELCNDIRKTSIENRKEEGNASTMPLTSCKATSIDVKMLYNKTDITSGSLSEIAGPSTAHNMSVANSATGQSMRGKIAIAERRKKLFRKRRDSIVPKGFDPAVEKKIMKLTDEIDQIDAVLAKEIDKKDEYFQRGYKVTHQILANLKKEKETQN